MVILWVVFGTLCVAGFLVYVYGIEPYRFRVLHKVVHCPRLPLENLRVLHLTDSHFKKGDTDKLEFAKSLGQYEVDFVFLTGDLIETEEGIDSIVDVIRSMRARHGIFAVLGTHDYYRVTIFDVILDALTAGGRHRTLPNPVGELIARMEAAGARVLVNDCEHVAVNGAKIAICGVDDPFLGTEDLPGTLANVNGADFLILLIHCPDIVHEVAASRVDAAFAGHTHGGQIRLPWIGALITRSKLPRRHAAGVFRIGDTVFHLNNGLGSGRWTHLRLFCQPEATIVDIRRE